MLLRRGVPLLTPCARLLLRWGKMRAFIDAAQAYLESRGYRTWPEGLCSLCCLGAVLIGMGASLFSASLIGGISAVLVCCLIASTVVARAKEARITALREAVPDALRAMAVCSQAGLSLAQTFKQVSVEGKGPLATLYLHAVHDLETGHTVAEALDHFKKAASIPELAFVSVALDVQHRAGGSLQQVLEVARESVENELELKRSLKVQTAQAKLSAQIVSVMPLALIALFSLISPGFLSPFFQSVPGLVLLGLAVLMQVSGILLVRRILEGGVAR
ncbi:MAG: type II secretion system F family protein [Coriobacteriaceae bacterium]|nr:type II secretion system F family protein [Coriobacteriaceae bacterium]